VSVLVNKLIILIILILSIINVTAVLEQQGFLDQDQDGIPDNLDACPNSITSLVDQIGCTCEQKDCSCSLVNNIPTCINTCEDSVKNKDETGIDCGGSCTPCIEEESINCENGCPNKFSCSNDQCLMKVSQQGKKCKTHDVQYSLNSMDCKKFGSSWEKEDLKNMLDIKADSFLPFLEGIAEDEADDKLKKATLCVDTIDIGCSSKSIKCFGENQLTPETKDKAEKILKDYIGEQIDKDLPWYIDWFIDLEVLVNLDDFKISENYECPDYNLNAENVCKEYIKNGGDSKVDIFIIGDGYKNEENFVNELQIMIDYDSQGHGLFSEEPFKSSKEKFNVWYIHSNNEVKYKQDPYMKGFGSQPYMPDVVKLANKCPWFDYVMFISKDHKFRSNSMAGKPGPARISLSGENHPDRLFIHEFGHAFSGLMDEYYNVVENKPSSTGFEEFYSAFQTGPNCLKNEEEANKAWQGIPNVVHYKGCGGDCNSGCDNFLRPSFNSIMRSQNKKCSPDGCQNGPPFDQFYNVNEKNIQNELKSYN